MRGLKVTIAALCIGAIPLGVHETGLTWNASPSMPVGVWQVGPMKRPITRGDIVVLCLPPAASALGLQRGYVLPGDCPTGSEKLLKPAAAVPGDVVQVSDQGIAVNGVHLENSAPLPADDLGRPMTPVPAGTYTVSANDVWAISGHDPRSFDSRYYGPIPVQNLRGQARAVFVGK
jgi:conjugative transfer signal peptidase TraF